MQKARPASAMKAILLAVLHKHVVEVELLVFFFAVLCERGSEVNDQLTLTLSPCVHRKAAGRCHGPSGSRREARQQLVDSVGRKLRLHKCACLFERGHLRVRPACGCRAQLLVIRAHGCVTACLFAFQYACVYLPYLRTRKRSAREFLQKNTSCYLTFPVYVCVSMT